MADLDTGRWGVGRLLVVIALAGLAVPFVLLNLPTSLPAWSSYVPLVILGGLVLAMWICIAFAGSGGRPASQVLITCGLLLTVVAVGSWQHVESTWLLKGLMLASVWLVEQAFRYVRKRRPTVVHEGHLAEKTQGPSGWGVGPSPQWTSDMATKRPDQS